VTKFDHLAKLGITGLLLALLAGCSQNVPGTPNASTAPGASDTSGSGAPNNDEIADPLDPTAFLNRPCDLVPQQLLTQLGFTAPGTPDTSSNTAKNLSGPNCGWISTAESKNMSINVPVLAGGKHGGGIETVFQARDQGGYAYADATKIDGYPGAYADIADDRAQGDCSLHVGIQNDLTFALSVSGYHDAQDSCGTAAQIADAVIKTLQGGS
jgi:hypothetical protein